MKHMILFLLIVLLMGCDQSAFVQPPPTISVERVGNYDTYKNTFVMTITFRQLRANRGTGMTENSEPGIIIKTPEDLAQYKEQVKFLLTQIEEAQDFMKIKEIDKSQLGAK